MCVGSGSLSSIRLVSRAWPSSTTTVLPPPVVTRISGGNRAPDAAAFARSRIQSLA